MSKYAVKGAVRGVKNYAKGYSGMEVKVRQATSNDPWGPSGTAMAEIAQATHDSHAFGEIMGIIFKRLNDKGKNWRHVFKALTVLDYCIHNGSEDVVAYTLENLYIVKTLGEFQHIDDEGRDQGANVRQKAKDIADLLSDNERLRRERGTWDAARGRVGGGNLDSRGDYGDDDPDLQRAIEESRKTAQEHERRMRESDDDLRRALELSDRDADARSQREADLMFGATPVSFDPYAPLDRTTVVQQQAGNSSAFGLPLGGVLSHNPYQQPQTVQAQPFPSEAASWGNSVSFAAPLNQATNPFGSAFPNLPVQGVTAPSALGSSTEIVGFPGASLQGGTNPFQQLPGAPQPTFGGAEAAGNPSTNPFAPSFDNGPTSSFARHGVAPQFTGASDAGSYIGGPDLATGNAQIDPFARVAGGREAFPGQAARRNL